MAFRSVFIDGKIINPMTGRSIDLSLFGQNSLPYLQSVSIGLERGANMNLSINLAPPYEAALELISADNEWIRLGNTLGLRWGYSDVEGAISDWHYGFMQTPSASFGDEISIAITASTLAWNTDRVSRVRCWGTEEEPYTFEKIATEIATRYGMEVEFGILDKNLEYLVDNLELVLVQGGRTDLHFLMSEGEKLGVRLIINNQKFIFVEASAPLKAYPTVNATFRMRGKMDIRDSVFPMTSFTPESMGALFIKNREGVTAIPFGPNDDPAEKKEVVVSDDANAEQGSYTSDHTVAAPSLKDGLPKKGAKGEKLNVKTSVKVDHVAGESGRHFSLPLHGKNYDKAVNGYLSAAREGVAQEHGIAANFGCFAMPKILPGMYVRLEGIGDYFTGNYLLQKVDVTIDSGGAEMDCYAFAKGFPGLNPSLDSLVRRLKVHKGLKMDK
jgi:hypothetical protein